MSHLKYFDYKGAFAERSKKEINYSQAVRIDNRVEVSGQGKKKDGKYLWLALLTVDRWLGPLH